MNAGTSTTRSSQLCVEVGVGYTGGGVEVEDLRHTNQCLGIVDDTLSGSSGEAAIKCRRPQAVARRREGSGLEHEAVGNTKQ